MSLTSALKFSLYIMKLQTSQLKKRKKALSNISKYVWLLGISLVAENLLSLKDEMSDSKRKETKLV